MRASHPPFCLLAQYSAFGFAEEEELTAEKNKTLKAIQAKAEQKRQEQKQREEAMRKEKEAEKGKGKHTRTETAASASPFKIVIDSAPSTSATPADRRETEAERQLREEEDRLQQERDEEYAKETGAWVMKKGVCD